MSGTKMGKIIKLNNKMEKLTNEEFEEFKQNYTEHQQTILNLGFLEAESSILRNQLNAISVNKEALLNKLAELSTAKQEIGNKLGEKYGEKQVDLETGELK
jgi:hypothetical protein